MAARRKKVCVLITEYWDISHADVIVTKILEGFSINGISYTSSLEIVAMYVDQFPANDISRGLAAKHGVPLFDTVEEALLGGGHDFRVDGILIIGEHGDYPKNRYGQILYPRKLLFDKCLRMMLEYDRIVPLFTDKGYAIETDDIIAMYEQVKKHNIPFMSSSSIPFAFPRSDSPPVPGGAPLHRMFGFIFGDLERYAYHTLEMMQAYAERRAGGESGIASVAAYEGDEALTRLFSSRWHALYRSLGGFINLTDLDRFPHTLDRPVFVEVNYADGLQSSLLYADKEVNKFVSCCQINENAPLYCTEFCCQWQKPYVHAAVFVLEIERFIHTGRPVFPVERSLLTTGAADAIMKSLHMKRTIETPYLQVVY